jgi:hypothetical protein
MLACEGEAVRYNEFRDEEGERFYFEFIRFALLVVPNSAMSFSGFLDLCLGRCPLLPHSLDGSLHLCDGPI